MRGTRAPLWGGTRVRNRGCVRPIAAAQANAGRSDAFPAADFAQFGMHARLHLAGIAQLD
jgi:hypothetical protein